MGPRRIVATAFPHPNAGKRDLVRPRDTYTNMSVILSVLCDSEGGRFSLEDKKSDQNSFEDLLRLCDLFRSYGDRDHKAEGQAGTRRRPADVD